MKTKTISVVDKIPMNIESDNGITHLTFHITYKDDGTGFPILVNCSNVMVYIKGELTTLNELVVKPGAENDFDSIGEFFRHFSKGSYIDEILKAEAV